MTISIRQKICESILNFLVARENETPSSVFHEIFQKRVIEKETLFNKTDRSQFEKYRKTVSYDPFLAGYEEENLLMDALQKEIAGTFGYNRIVPFSLTLNGHDFPDANLMSFSNRHAEMILLSETSCSAEERKALKMALYSFFSPQDSQTKREDIEKRYPILHQRIFVLNSYLWEKNKTCYNKLIADNHIKILRDITGPIFTQLLSAQSPREILDAFEPEVQKAVEERVFCELYLAAGDGLTGPQDKNVTLESVRDCVLAHDVARVRDLFVESFSQEGDRELADLKGYVGNLFANAQQAEWVQKLGLQTRLKTIGEEIFSKFTSVGFASEDHRRSLFLPLFTSKSLPVDTPFALPTEEGRKQLEHIKKLFELQIALMEPPSTIQKLKKSKIGPKRSLSISSPRRTSSEDVEVQALLMARRRLAGSEFIDLIDAVQLLAKSISN